MESVLISIKKLLGITEECTHFDDDIIMDINTVLAALDQLGVGNGTVITGADETWNDIIGDDARLNFVKSYIHLRVKQLFDPPLSSSVAEAMERTVKELEWRIILVSDEPLA